MALTPIGIQKRGSSGGGGLGSVIGGVVGAIAGAPFGQPLAGFSVGSTVGGVVGGKVDPGKAGSSTQLTPMQSRQPAEIPHSEILEQSLAALQQAPPEFQQAYGEPLTKAYEMSKRRGGYA